MDLQKTIIKEAQVKGVGLHTGNKVSITFKPAAEDQGINFIRVDLPGRPSIKACTDNLLASSGSMRCSSIGQDDIQIHTIEHLMAAAVGMGIDNLNVEIDANEVPGLDGSSQGWVELLNKCGIKEQSRQREYFVVKEPIFLGENSNLLIALPNPELKISYTLDYNHPFLKTSYLEITLDQESFCKELAAARTFCLEAEAQKLRDNGLGKGATYENTLVVDEKGVVNNKLRYENEFVRHKVLDLLGDLYLLGQQIKGHIIAIKSGHYLNMKLLRKLDTQKQRAVLGGISIKYPDSEELDITQIMNVLPHREPFLFVDRILSLERGKRVVGLKNVTINDYFFKGHFPGKPVMPGVLIIEAMAQVGGVMMLSIEENRGKIAYFMSIKEAKFRKTVVPGDQLVMEVEAGKMKSKIGMVHGKALVDGKVVAEAELMFALAD